MTLLLEGHCRKKGLFLAQCASLCSLSDSVWLQCGTPEALSPREVQWQLPVLWVPLLAFSLTQQHLSWWLPGAPARFPVTSGATLQLEPGRAGWLLWRSSQILPGPMGGFSLSASTSVSFLVSRESLSHLSSQGQTQPGGTGSRDGGLSQAFSFPGHSAQL